MTPVVIEKVKIEHLYIEKKTGVCGGDPVIVNTRISVSLIVEMKNAGNSVDDMIDIYPHITHAQVYDALSYYYDTKMKLTKLLRRTKKSFGLKRQRMKVGENKDLY